MNVDYVNCRNGQTKCKFLARAVLLNIDVKLLAKMFSSMLSETGYFRFFQ